MKHFVYISIFILLCACSTTKNIPEGKYLLTKASIETDNKDIGVIALENFLRQKPNSSIPLFGKVRLRIHSLAGQDTSRWFNRFLPKLGQAPVIYNPRLTQQTAEQIQKQLSNQGYLDALVDTVERVNDKTIDITYQITSNKPYTIRKYEYDIEDPILEKVMERVSKFSQVKEGDLFDQEVLEENRLEINNRLRNLGYYTLTKQNLYEKADTTLGSHQVDLYLSLRKLDDSTEFHPYRFRNITIVSGYDVTDDNNKEYFEKPDTTYSKGITIVHGKNNFIRNSTLLRNNYLQPGKLYSDRSLSKTYSALNSISAIKQTNIEITPVKEDDSTYFVDAHVIVSQGNAHWFQAILDGTNSAGDFGIAPTLSYQHQNLFNGAEILSFNLKGAYEFITGSKSTDLINANYYEYGGDIAISFPQFLFPWLKKSWREIPNGSTQFSLGLNNQYRSEYKRQFFNATQTYRWGTNRGQLSHTLDFFEINYVRTPWISSKFEESLKKNPILKASYDDQLIARSSYNISYTSRKQSAGRKHPINSYNVRAGIDLAGWLPNAIKMLGGTSRKPDGKHTLMGIAYAEYIKANLSFSHTINIDRQKSLAYNISVGAANPFGNSEMLPYERRFFSGGANSVRGWSTRKLGPGSYQSNDSTSFVNQTGDIKLDLNIEYRNKVSDYIELAGFVDAGNIWTIKDYEGQEGGRFELNKFYKEIAVAYGVGIRFDLDFLLLRLDLGMKAYDPSRREGDRLIVLQPKFSRDAAIHFAIGYPF